MDQTAKTILIVVAVVLGVLLVVPSFAGVGMMGAMGPAMMGGWGRGWGGGMGGLGSLLFLALVGGGVYLVVRAVGGSPGAQGGETALDILKRRYARGEISKEEFEEKRQELQ